MYYDFPIIDTIDDVLPAIKDCDEFIVIDKDRYKIIDYILQSAHTFPAPYTLKPTTQEHWQNALKRECRGLAFYPNGNIMSRPFHKFFNYGEKPLEQTNLDHPAHVLQKLDGSMIRPFLFADHFRLATRKGITDVAMQAEIFIADKPNYSDLILKQTSFRRTPIFEWCSRRNQIVLDYAKDDLVLLALRDNRTGHYFEHSFVEALGKHHNITVVGEFIIPEVNHLKIEHYVDYAKTLQDAEGCVIVFPNGHKLKAKGEWYTTLHKAKDMIGREKDMIKVFLQGSIDDLLVLFSEKDRHEINEFLDKLTLNLLITTKRLNKLFQEVKEAIPEEYTRKDFALEVLKRDPKYKTLLFSMLAGDEPLNLLTEMLIKACGKMATLEEHRWIFGGIKFREKKSDAE